MPHARRGTPLVADNTSGVAGGAYSSGTRMVASVTSLRSWLLPLLWLLMSMNRTCSWTSCAKAVSPRDDGCYLGALGGTPVEDCRHLDLRDAGDLSGTGVRFVPIAHHGNTASSPEEAAAVRDLIAQLTGATFVDHRRRRHTISHGDIAVITPYNAQVARLDRVPPPDVGRGTVDRYQGKTAAVVIISLAARSAETAPRGLDFLLDRNRLNVALSRARAAVFVVGSPQLMNAAPTTIRTIEAANDLCVVTAGADLPG